MLRIPDEALESVVSLRLSHDGNYRYAGTGFFLSMPGPTVDSSLYFMTARHNVEMGKPRRAT